MKSVSVCVKGKGEGEMYVSDEDGNEVAKIPVKAEKKYKSFSAPAKIADGKHALFFTYAGSGAIDFKSFVLE